MKNKISFSEFLEIEKKLEITFGLVIEAKRIPKKDKLLKLTVDFGKDDVRTVVTNIGDKFEVDEIIHETLPFITNLEPAEIAGIVSEAMIMVTTFEGKVCLLDTRKVEIGTRLL